MTEQEQAHLQAHMNNIDRYLGLLQTLLSESERAHVEKLLTEERAKVDAAANSSGLQPPKEDYCR